MDQDAPKNLYKVLVDDNFHHMDASERYQLGVYDSCESAVAASQKLVDDFLLTSHKPSIPWEELWQQYTSFGDDPFIVTADPDCSFSAWDYARERCKELCE
jgi:hypothetical protein